METLILTAPVVVPASTTDTYRVVAITLNLEAIAAPATVAGLILIDVRDNHDERRSFSYAGQVATDLIRALNTANLSTKSLQKRILERLSADGLLVGTVTGTPDP